MGPHIEDPKLTALGLASRGRNVKMLRHIVVVDDHNRDIGPLINNTDVYPCRNHADRLL